MNTAMLTFFLRKTVFFLLLLIAVSFLADVGFALLKGGLWSVTFGKWLVALSISKIALYAIASMANGLYHTYKLRNSLKSE